MSSTPREIGTLIVVILKANHLPNKRHIGKQDPYCVVSVNGEKQRTKVVKRGGQHPEWDEEIRFTLYEDDSVVPTASHNGTPPPPPPKDGKKKIKGGEIMKLSCFADDPREPDLIGQADVELTEVLTKGETDEWFTLMNKDKFAGKVYLELTFWSNEPPPEKKFVPPKGNKDYVGPGLFTPSDDAVPVPGSGYPGSRIASTSSVYDHSRRQSDSIPSSIRTSHSLAQLDLYNPPYEQERNRVSSFNALTNDFGEFGVSDLGRRRESFPPPQTSIYGHRPPTSSGFSTYPPPHGYEPTVSDAASIYPYDRPLTPPGQSHDPTAFGHPVPYAPQAPYLAPYESGSVYHPPPARGPRYSMPTTSSGFMPLAKANPSGFATLPSHPSDPSGFAPPLSHTPVPMSYSASHIAPQSTYAPLISQTPAPYAPPLPPSSSASFHPQKGFSPSQSFQYSQFQPQPPPHQYNTPQQTHMQTPTPPAQQEYQMPPTPPNQTPAPLSHSNSLSSSTGPGSRPLPVQPQMYGQPAHQPYSLPPSSSQSHPGAYSPTQHPGSHSPTQHPGSHSPTHPGGPDSYQPPPPPPVSLHQSIGHQSYVPNDPHSNPNAYQAPPPPPPLPSHSNTASPRRQSSLPPPPTQLQQPNYPPLPPPPPPPPSLEYSPQNPPPPPPPLPSHFVSQAQPYYPGPPPRPPVQLEGQTQWAPPSSQPLQNGYTHQGWA